MGARHGCQRGNQLASPGGLWEQAHSLSTQGYHMQLLHRRAFEVSSSSGMVRTGALNLPRQWKGQFEAKDCMKTIFCLVLVSLGQFGTSFAVAQSIEIDKIAPIAAPVDLSFNACAIPNCYGAKGNSVLNGSPHSFVSLNRFDAEFPEAKPYLNEGFFGFNNCTNCSHEGDGYFPGVLAKAWQCPIGYTSSPNSIFKCIRAVSAVDPGKNNECDETTGCSKVGDPINYLSGVVTETIDDYRAPYGRLAFSRFHNSRSPYTIAWSPLGKDWAHTYTKTVKANTTEVGATAFVQRPSGNFYIFRKEAGGGWLAEGDVRLSLEELTHNGAHIGWIVREVDDSEEIYTPDGKLLGIQWSDGSKLSLTYEQGRLRSVVDERGRSIYLTYDADSRLLRVMLPDGSQFGYEYTRYKPFYRLSRVTFYEPGASAGSQVAAYGYELTNGTHYLSAAYDENNVRVSSWTYDWAGKGTSVVRGEPTSTTDKFTINYGSGSTTVVGPLGGSVSHAYVNHLGRNKLSGSSGSCRDCGSNGFSSRTYDANGYPDVTISLSGSVTDADYDSRGLVTKEINALGTPQQRTQETVWHTSFRLPLGRTVRGADGLVVTTENFSYNTRGQVLSSTRIDGVGSRLTNYSYCEQPDVDAGHCPLVGQIRSIDGPRAELSDTTTYTYYASDATTCASIPATCPYRKGDLWKVTNGLGQTFEILGYDGSGRVLRSKDRNGLERETTYYPRGWIASVILKGTTTTEDRSASYQYWPTGLVKKVTEPDGTFTSFEYDNAHRLTAIVDSSGNRIEYMLDAAGNRIAENTKGSGGALKRTLSRVYNTLGQLATQADAQANPTDFTYDAVGNSKTVTDALGHVTSNDYDPLNRLKRTLQDVGGIEAETKFEYDANHNLTKVTDPKGLDTTYTYNGFGDLVQLSSPDTGVTTYTYDSAGNRASQTDARGITTTYQYDALNRLTQVGYPTSSLNVSYTYDVTQPVCQAGETFSVGRLTLMVDGSGSTQYCHDRFGQLVRKVQTTNGVTLTLQYAYTKGGQLQAMTYPDGTVVDYVRNAQGQITEVGVAQPSQAREILLTGATYHPFGPIAGWVYGNGRVMQRNVDLDYRPTSIQGGPGGLDLTYGYDAVGNLTSLASGSPPPLEYGYDALGRLTEIRDGPTQAVIDQYTYDKTGNRTSYTDSLGTKVYAYPSTSHRLSSVAGENRSYDAVGNTLVVGSVRAFTYNDVGHMEKILVGGSEIVAYTYNGRAEVVAGSTALTTTRTVFDESGRWLSKRVSGSDSDQIAIWLDGMIIGAVRDSELVYTQSDALGSVRAIVSAAGNEAIWRWDAKGEAFGTDLADEDADGDSSTYSWSGSFPGQMMEPTSRISQNRFRNYDSSVGRYLESDPIGLGAGPSTYAYANNNPLSFVDELGLQATTADRYCLQYPLWCVGGVGGAAVVVSPKPQSLTSPSAKATDTKECDYGTCATKYPEYDLCFEVSRSYPYAMLKHALLDFPAGSKARTPTPATGGICSVKGVHQTVYLNGIYVGSVFSCNCCTNTAGGPVLSEIWGNNRGR